MPLQAGQQLGSYEITSLLGKGGMGEVYRAHDTKLGRDVAVKALADVFAHDADRLTRFEREAQALAALKHPNLAVIHELKEVDGASYLILELVEGETLAERIARGPLPLDAALDLARQIAEGLEAAHDKGIVHRDLKPANIKVTPEGRVKVLDFGLAKIYESASAPSNLSNSPTLSAAQTAGGVILGTAAYMSPEQARGKDVDRRADIWAFGCVLYEMLTGRQAFPVGQTVSDTIAAILVHEPDWQALPAGTPAKVRTLLERCLRKDEKRRWSDIADVRIEIEEARKEQESSILAVAAPKPSRRRELVLTLLALAFFLTASGGLAWLALGPAPDTRPLELEVIAPAGTPLGALSQAELSPDGRKLAFLATSDNKRLIWVRPLDSTAEPLPGTEGITGTEIFWSEDSQYIGFSAEGKLKKVAANGGPSQTVGALPPSGTYAGTWNAAGVILLGSEAGPGGPLLRVAAGGGQPAPASELDASRKETAHGYPHFLPDGQHYFFLARSSDPQNAFAAYVGELDSKERHPLAGIASEVQYSSTGHLVFIRDGALMAQPFDAKSLALTGDAFTIADEFVAAKAVTGPFSLSVDGRLAYFKSANLGGAGGNTQLAWRDRTGAPIGPVGPEGEYLGPELSPDEKFVAFSRGNPGNIWILDIERNLAEPLTNDPADDRNSRWSPNGRTIAFQSNRDGGDNFYTRAVGVVAEDKLLLKNQTAAVLSDWSPDGRYLAYTSEGDVWALPMPGGPGDSKSGEPKPLPVTRTPATELTPRISPDGRWIAYVSNEPGQNEVYVQSFPDPGIRQKVSTAGGVQPRWSRDSSELFYYQTGSGIAWMAVSIKFSGGALAASAPITLFPRFGVVNTAVYSVSAADRFLMQLNPGAGAVGGRGGLNNLALPNMNRIVVLFHWDKRGQRGR